MQLAMVAGLMAMGAAAVPAIAEAQESTLPAPSTLGIARVAILCLMVDPTTDRLRAQQRLCEQVRRIAAVGAPVPVATIGFGDPALLRRDVLGLLVHAAVDRNGAHPALVLSIRPHRTAIDASVLFGATPVVVPLAADGAVPDAAVAAALDQVLPWRTRAPR